MMDGIILPMAGPAGLGCGDGRSVNGEDLVSGARPLGRSPPGLATVALGSGFFVNIAGYSPSKRVTQCKIQPGSRVCTTQDFHSPANCRGIRGS